MTSQQSAASRARRSNGADASAQSDGRSAGGRRLAFVAGGALLVLALAGGWVAYRRLTRTRSPIRGEPGTVAATTKGSVTVGKPAGELHDLWREPETLARAFGDFADVTRSGEDRLRWELAGPLGYGVAWEMRLVEDDPGEALRWETDADAPVDADLAVRFRPAPGDRGTEVNLEVRVVPPGGPAGGAVAKRLGVVPDALAEVALDRFKSLAETGEVPTLEGNPSARGRGDLL